MSFENQKTLEIYQRKAATYLKTSIEHDAIDADKAAKKKQQLQTFIRENLRDLPAGARVLEIGAASGDNAKFISSLGYQVTASDLAPAFLTALKAQGLTTVKFNVLTDAFPGVFAAVFCWRVLVHFTFEDTRTAMEQIYRHLQPGGLFIFNAMNRECYDVAEAWVDFDNEYHWGEARYYKYYTQKELDDLARQTGFKIKHFHCEGGTAKHKWLVYVLQK